MGECRNGTAYLDEPNEDDRLIEKRKKIRRKFFESVGLKVKEKGVQ